MSKNCISVIDHWDGKCTLICDKRLLSNNFSITHVCFIFFLLCTCYKKRLRNFGYSFIFLHIFTLTFFVLFFFFITVLIFLYLRAPEHVIYFRLKLWSISMLLTLLFFMFRVKNNWVRVVCMFLSAGLIEICSRCNGWSAYSDYISISLIFLKAFL